MLLMSDENHITLVRPSIEADALILIAESYPERNSPVSIEGIRPIYKGHNKHITMRTKILIRNLNKVQT